MSQVNFKKYANQVVAQLDCNAKTKKRIREDIIDMLNEKAMDRPDSEPVELVGSVSDMVDEFTDNLENYSSANQGRSYNKKSKISILGLPLYHITGNQNIIAKGILAIGPKSIGIISFGGISFGIISFGGISIGVFSLGGLALAVLGAVGGLAIAADIAIGGLAIAYSMAIGGLAIAKDVAIGGITSAQLMGYSQSFINPRNVDEGVFRAFKIPETIKEFRNAFDDMAFNFGLVKNWIIDSLIKDISTSK